MGKLARIKSWLEGQWRGPFAGQGELTGATFELGQWEDGWQRNLTLPHADVRHVPMVYACVMANARAAATCWPRHQRETRRGSLAFEQVTSSPASRIFREANPYETWPVFLLNMVAAMGFDGQSYAVAARDDRGAITALHRMPRGTMTPMVDEGGAVHYAAGFNPFMPQGGGTEWMVPARDVWHLRQHCPRHPLLGESASAAAGLAMGVNVALSSSQAVFFSRMSRPSGVLVSDQQLTKDQITRLRENWNAQASLLAKGGVPILGNGVKWQPMSMNSEDSQVAEALRFSGEDIARVHGVPLPVVGELSHATLTNVEQLVSLWLSTGLTSLLELIERDLNRLFGFDGSYEYADLDTRALLRTDFAGRIDALVKGVQGALFKPNEARALEGLPPVEAGDDLYAQVQMQPLGTPIAAPAAAPAAPPADDDDKTDDDTQEDGDDDEPATDEEARAFTAWALERAMRRAQEATP